MAYDSGFKMKGHSLPGPNQRKDSPAKGILDSAKKLANKVKKVAKKVKNEAVALKEGFMNAKGMSVTSSNRNAKSAYYQEKQMQRGAHSSQMKNPPKPQVITKEQNMKNVTNIRKNKK